MRRASEAMRCDEIREILEPYLDGDLSAAETEGVRVHLEGCQACAKELALAVTIQNELRALPQLDCPPEVLARVREAGRGQVVPFRGRPRAWRTFQTAAAAAALALTVGAGYLLHQRTPAGPSPAEVSRATAEARFALAYLGKVNRKAGLELRDDVFDRRLVAPVTQSVSRSLDAFGPEAAGSTQEVLP